MKFLLLLSTLIACISSQVSAASIGPIYGTSEMMISDEGNAFFLAFNSCPFNSATGVKKELSFKVTTYECIPLRELELIEVYITNVGTKCHAGFVSGAVRISGNYKESIKECFRADELSLANL